MATNKKQTIEISDMKIRPFDPTSKLAHERPGLQHFDNRRDFILFGHMNYVAAVVKIINTTCETSRPKAVSGTMFISIRNADTGEIVSSRTFSVKMEAFSEWEWHRVDIPCGASSVSPDYAYRVEASYAGDDECTLSRNLRFIKPDRLPTKLYRTDSGRVVMQMGAPDMFEEPKPQSLTATFSLEYTQATDVPCVEIEYRHVCPDGEERTGMASVETSSGSDDDGIRMVSAGVDIPQTDAGLGTHYIELKCMGYPFAGLLFEIAGSDIDRTFEPGMLAHIPDYNVDKGCGLLEKLKDEETDRHTARNEAHSRLDSMVGLESVKTKVRSLEHLSRFNQLRTKAGLPCYNPPLHAMFMGSPGTGKTTVAKIIGTILHEAGVLSSGHVVVRERATLLGQFYNSESEKTLKALKEAQGGILFIDEAYQLNQSDDPRDPGRFVLETLMTALADESKRDWMLILAGYTGPMMDMMKINPGLGSRIPSTNYYHFEDFSPEQLKLIADSYFSANGFTLTSSATRALNRLLDSDYQNRGDDFGNARHVINIIQTGILPAMATRIAGIEHPTTDELSTIRTSDIPAPVLANIRRRMTVGFAG